MADTEKITEDEETVGNKKATAIILQNAVVDKVVKLVVGSLSWASAGLTSTAASATIEYSTDSLNDQVLWSWIYFVVIFLLSAVMSIIPFTHQKPRELAKELEMKVPKRNAKKRDTEENKQLLENKEKAKKRGAPKGALGNAKRVLHFVEVQGAALLGNLVDLVIQIWANVVALAINDAVTLTFTKMNSGSMNVASHWLFSFGMSIITAIVCIKAGQYLESLEKSTYEQIKNDGFHNIKDDLIIYGSKKNAVNLLTTSLGLAMAWAWRNAIKATILGLYGADDDETLAGLWTYCAISTLIAAYAYTICDRYDILQPKDGEMAMQIESKERELIGGAFYGNFPNVAGLAWYGAIVASFEQAEKTSTQVVLYWTITPVIITAAVVGEFAWQTYWINFKVKCKGVVHTVYEFFPNMHDPEEILEEDVVEKRKADTMDTFSLTYCKEFVEMLILSWGVAGSWTVSAAVKYTLIALYSGYYDPDAEVDISSKVLWSMWVAVLIAYAVSAAILTYLSVIVEKIRAGRRLALEEIKEAAEAVENKVEALEERVERYMTEEEDMKADDQAGADEEQQPSKSPEEEQLTTAVEMGNSVHAEDVQP